MDVRKRMEERTKVVLVPCKGYDSRLVYEQLKRGMELLGGMEQFVAPGERLLVKPNFLKRAEPEKAVMTHPAVMEAFCRLLYEAGGRDITLGDSCGHGTTGKVAAGTGLEEALRKYGVKLKDFTDGGAVPYEAGKQAQEFRLCQEIVDADGVFSLSKMKTHALERITGAVKNSYGFIYGFYKAKGHTQYPSADSFARMLVDLNQCVKPRLYIMDGILAMEGNGPGSGDPVPMNVLLLSEDPVALDTVFCRLIHLKPQLVPTNYHGEKMGLGTSQEKQIQVLTPEGVITVEEAARQYGNPRFHVDRKPVKKDAWVGMARVLNLFQKKPRIIKTRCVKCGICVESCPVPGKAVNFRDGRKAPPVYDYSKCIRCYCCQEMCPKKAIVVK